MLVKLECKGCGGSDFEKHPIIDEFLVCANCGNQYEYKTREILEELPFNLKVEIRGNNNDLSINNAIIYGNNNDIKGYYNICIGNNNDMRGIGNIAKGNNNDVKEKKLKQK